MAAQKNITSKPAEASLADDQATISRHVARMLRSAGPETDTLADDHKLSRRDFMGSAAVAVLPASGASMLTGPALANDGHSDGVTPENPALLDAYARFLSASAERDEAKAALDWLADEWRHRWPLAPEELLGGANADYPASSKSTNQAERDILGNYLRRDTSVLLKRFNRKQRQKTPVACFSVLTPEEAQAIIEVWTSNTPAGRTEKALQRNREKRERIIREYQHNLSLARQYQAETAYLRELAGVATAKRRIAAAESQLRTSRSEVARLPAFTHEGLQLKAAALSTYRIFDAASALPGPFDEMASLLRAISGIKGGKAV